MDRAHRIGQKKQVRVFRLITENSVDELIVQRAEAKLRLTNMMIERGLTFEDNAKIPFGARSNVLRYGIDSIRASDAAGITHVNLAELFAYSRKKTDEEIKKLKVLNEDQLRNIAFDSTSAMPVDNNQTSIPTRVRRQQQLLQSTNENQQRPSGTSNPNSIRVAQFALEKPSVASVNNNRSGVQATQNLPMQVKLPMICNEKSNENQHRGIVMPSSSSTPNTSDNSSDVSRFQQSATTAVNIIRNQNALPANKILSAASNQTVNTMQSLSAKMVIKYVPGPPLPANSILTIRPSNNIIQLRNETSSNSNISKTNSAIRFLSQASNQNRNLPSATSATQTQTLNETSSKNGQTSNGVAESSNKTANPQSSVQAIQQVNQNQHLSPVNGTSPVSNGRFINLNVYKFYPEELVSMCDGTRVLDMSTDTNTKKALLVKGFHEWSHNDYITFCNAVQRYGRCDVERVSEMMPSKRVEEILRYHEVFFRRGPKESQDIDGIVTKIKSEEANNRQRDKAFQWKMLQFGRPEFLSTRVTQNQNAKFTHDHVRYLICAISRYGWAFNLSDRVISDIRYVSVFCSFKKYKICYMHC